MRRREKSGVGGGRSSASLSITAVDALNRARHQKMDRRRKEPRTGEEGGKSSAERGREKERVIFPLLPTAQLGNWLLMDQRQQKTKDATSILMYWSKLCWEEGHHLLDEFFFLLPSRRLFFLSHQH